MLKKALIVSGGWEGHEPIKIAEIFANLLKDEKYQVKVSHSLNAFTEEKLSDYRLIVPMWSLTSLSDVNINDAQLVPVIEAVANGAGIAICHSINIFSLPGDPTWAFMTGGSWVAHPGGTKIRYKVNIRKSSDHPIIKGIDDFTVCTEQSYFHIDPAVEVLATTRFPIEKGPHAANGEVDIPVIIVKRWGKGRVYFCSLGHKADMIKSEPIFTLLRRGFLWAAKEI